MLGLFESVPAITYTQHDIQASFLYKDDVSVIFNTERSCCEETMRASVVLTFAVLALVFLAAYAADQEESDHLSLSVNEDNEEASVDGARVKRASKNEPPKKHAGAKASKKKGRMRAFTGSYCYAYYWGNTHCDWYTWGVRCHQHGPVSNRWYGGCQVYIWNTDYNGWNECYAEGPKGAYCYCNENSMRVSCRAP
ncbi:hypothetical protein LSAT2_009898 [Lamellibrachia satsuma]|nr:hypothetical protein LSAT2_009898 [Lamellibrachia satsuma]